MTHKALRDAIVELIRRASTSLPPDVETALRRARDRERRGSPAATALETVLENVAVAREKSLPICQDTGTNIYHVWYGREWWPPDVERAILAATRRATKLGYLRPNVVDPVTGRNTGDNVGRKNPVVHFHPSSRQKGLKMSLVLKGGGSENVSVQYSLPNVSLEAGRDLEGVRRCVLDAVYRAQGKGCAPGVVAVGIGGDRATSYEVAKEQLLRKLGQRHRDPALASLEERLEKDLNRLGIGPMGFGGKTTALGVLIGVADRLPASYFVSVAYMCWACRRATLVWRSDEPRYEQ